MANGTLKVSNIETSSGSGTITLGQSGETISVPSGATINLSSATQTGVGGVNTPAFEAKLGSVQDIGSSGVWTKINYDTETFDVGSNLGITLNVCSLDDVVSISILHKRNTYFLLQKKARPKPGIH